MKLSISRLAMPCEGRRSCHEKGGPCMKGRHSVCSYRLRLVHKLRIEKPLAFCSLLDFLWCMPWIPSTE